MVGRWILLRCCPDPDPHPEPLRVGSNQQSLKSHKTFPLPIPIPFPRKPLLTWLIKPNYAAFVESPWLDHHDNYTISQLVGISESRTAICIDCLMQRLLLKIRGGRDRKRGLGCRLFGNIERAADVPELTRPPMALVNCTPRFFLYLPLGGNYKACIKERQQMYKW